MAEDVTIELLGQMAALMDGQLVGPERTAFLARIAESEELYQLLLEATELREALDEEMGAPPEAGGPTPFGLTVAGPGEAGEARSEPDASPDSGASIPFPPPEARGSEGPPGGGGSRGWSPLTLALPLLAAAGLAGLLLIQSPSPGRELAWDLANPGAAPVPFQWQEVRGEVEEGAVVRVGGRWFMANSAARSGDEEAAYSELSALQTELARSGMPSLSAIVEVMVAERSFGRNRPVAELEEDLRAMDPPAFDAGLRLAALRTAALRGSTQDVGRLMEQLRSDAAWLDSRDPSFLRDLEEAVAAGDLATVATVAERALVLLGTVG